MKLLQLANLSFNMKKSKYFIDTTTGGLFSAVGK